MVQSCLLSAWQLWQDSREFVDCLNGGCLVLPRAARKSGSIDGQDEFASMIGALGMRPLMDYHHQHSKPAFSV